MFLWTFIICVVSVFSDVSSPKRGSDEKLVSPAHRCCRVLRVARCRLTAWGWDTSSRRWRRLTWKLTNYWETSLRWDEPPPFFYGFNHQEASALIMCACRTITIWKVCVFISSNTVIFTDAEETSLHASQRKYALIRCFNFWPVANRDTKSNAFS